jgi:septum formation protein
MSKPPLFPWRLVLASASPRRRQLLQGLDLPVEITSVDVDETPPAGVPDDQVAELIAVRKADAWAGTLQPDQVLITADTTVVLEGHLLNKPENAADARRMLGLLSGNTHRVVTGVCMRSLHHRTQFADVAHVRFATLSDAEIDYYVDRYSPMDKAGAYGVQDWIGYVGVERIEGNFYTVMGLPMHRIRAALRNWPLPA